MENVLYYYYLNSSNPTCVSEHLNEFLWYQIYSPLVIRSAYKKWNKFSQFLQKNTPTKIVSLIQQSPKLSDKNIQTRLNQIAIQNAISVLNGYNQCSIPLTGEKEIPTKKISLLSKKGCQALERLQYAQEQKDFSDEMSQLALVSSHKFLLDLSFYRSFPINQDFALSLLKTEKRKTKPYRIYTFPTLQLTKGCVNNCSHCDCCAQPHLSHMPYPMFLGIYSTLLKYYKKYETTNDDQHSFCTFFADSDMISYKDSIIKADAGDVAMRLCLGAGRPFPFVTRGVSDDFSRQSLYKALLSDIMQISYVDTSRENKTHNLNQLSETLKIVRLAHRENPAKNILNAVRIAHVQSKNITSDLPTELVKDIKVEKSSIYAVGRAKTLPPEETDTYPDKRFFVWPIIAPNGDVIQRCVRNGIEHQNIIGNILTPPKITKKTRPFYSSIILKMHSR